MTLHHKQEEGGMIMTFKRVGRVKTSVYLTIYLRNITNTLCLLHVHKDFCSWNSSYSSHWNKHWIRKFCQNCHRGKM